MSRRPPSSRFAPALLIAFWIWRLRSEPPSVELTDTRADVEELLKAPDTIKMKNLVDLRRQRARRRMLAAAGAALLVAPFVSACQPLYGRTQSGARVKDVMASLEISEVPGRVGQKVRNELIFTSTGGGHSADPAYRLDITVRESVSNILVELTGDIQGQQFNLDADFTLVRLADKQTVLRGKSTGRAAFDRFDPIFTNIRARIDAENRAARVVADGIRTRIAAFLSSTA